MRKKAAGSCDPAAEWFIYLVVSSLFDRNRDEEAAGLVAADLPLDQEDDRVVVGGLHGGDDIVHAAHGHAVHFDDEVAFAYPVVVLGVGGIDGAVRQDLLHGDAAVFSRSSSPSLSNWMFSSPPPRVERLE